MPAVSAIFLASHLAKHRLVDRANLVSHVILKPVPPELGPDDDDFFLGNLDGLATLRTDIHVDWDHHWLLMRESIVGISTNQRLAFRHLVSRQN